MPLTKTVQEVKEMLPTFISNLGSNTSLPNFDAFEAKYLLPLTGSALYTDIVTKYTNNNLSESDTSLLKKMRLVAVAYAYHDVLALGHITLTDNGARKLLPNGATPVAKWEFEKVLSALHNTAIDATDVLLSYLFEQKPAAWTSAPEYSILKKLLIKTGKDFSAIYTLHQPMATFYSIKNLISDAQDIFLLDVIGKDLLSYLVDYTETDEDILSAAMLLKKALAYYSIKKCCEHYSVRFNRDGFTIIASENNSDNAENFGRKSATGSEIEIKMRACEQDAQNYLSRAKDALAAVYKKTGVAAEYRAAFEKSNLVKYEGPTHDSGNSNRKGIFSL